jgi:hypothetical protein
MLNRPVKRVVLRPRLVFLLKARLRHEKMLRRKKSELG